MQSSNILIGLLHKVKVGFHEIMRKYPLNTKPGLKINPLVPITLPNVHIYQSSDFMLFPQLGFSPNHKKIKIIII